MSIVSTFFKGKRSWSKIKDEVLGGYMPPYVAKLQRKKKPLLMIDAYAGPGVFEDGSVGSPILICRAAEKFAKNKYEAIFVNNNEIYHEKLSSVVTSEGWSANVTPILGDSTQLLKAFPKVLSDYSTFIYLDPFGLKGCDFELIEPFLKQPDTEIVLTMCMPIIHRLTSRKAVQQGRGEENLIKNYHSVMTNVFGGDYWKSIMLDPDVTPENREQVLMDAYCSKLKNYLPYVGRCPVREKSDQRVKYYIVFASPHPDSMELMNDNMMKAYFSAMHQADYANTLWANSDWRDMRDFKALGPLIINIVSANPGRIRKDIWSIIVQKHFMCFLESEYRNTVQALVEQDFLTTSTPRRTKRLNDNCILNLGAKKFL